MKYTTAMNKYLMPNSILKKEHMEEFLTKMPDGAEVTEQFINEGMEVFVFDIGFVIFEIDGTDAIISNYYHSADSATSVSILWDELRESFKQNGCTKIICHTKIEKLKNHYINKYGFTTSKWDEDLLVYVLEQKI